MIVPLQSLVAGRAFGSAAQQTHALHQFFQRLWVLPTALCHDAPTAGKPPFLYMNRSSALFLALAFLAGCQSTGPASSQPVPAQKDAPPAPEPKPQVYGSFTQDTLVSLLSAELAGQ
ncbi:TPR domain-containing protein, partial [Pseudomonas coronafaciens pv. oryzae]